MPPLLGNIIVIAALILLAGLALRQIIHDLKNGGCSGGCASCGKSCQYGKHESNISASGASDILKNIEKPKKLQK